MLLRQSKAVKLDFVDPFGEMIRGNDVDIQASWEKNPHRIVIGTEGVLLEKFNQLKPFFPDQRLFIQKGKDRLAVPAVFRAVRQSEDKGLHLLVNVDKGIPEYLVGDELRLAQILNNLISNAVKFTSVGYISIEVTKTLEFDDEVELFFVVSDTGIGISLAEKDKLFQSFSQVDASITRKYGGTGLGLAITRSAVLLHRGSIRVHSQEQQGTTFNVRIPLIYLE